jgi:hypothetical protein
MEEFASRVPSVVLNVAVGGHKLNPDIVQTDGSEGPQLREVDLLLSDYVRRGVLSEKRVDYLIVSAGGNDMHKDALRGLATRLLISIWNPFNNPFFIRIRNDIMANLQDFKKDLDRFHQILQTNPIYRNARVIYCTYPDSTRNENGQHTEAPSILLPRVNRKVTTLGDKDFEFAYELMIRNLNKRIKNFWKLDPHRYTQNDVEPISRKHGYPARHSYFVRFRAIEGPLMFEAFHPTIEGHDKIYFDTVFPLLKPMSAPARFNGGEELVSHRPL